MNRDLNTLAFAGSDMRDALVAWKDRLNKLNDGDLFDFWMDGVPFAKAWQERAFALLGINRASGKRYAAMRDEFLASAMPGVDKNELTALLWLGERDHVAIAREHKRGLNWAGEVRKLNSPRAIRNAVQRVVNARIEAEEAQAAAQADADDLGLSVEEMEEQDYDASIQAMLDQDEVAAEDRPEAGVVGAWLKRTKFHRTIRNRVIAVKGDDFMREMAMAALIELIDAENQKRTAAGRKPYTMGQYFKANKFEV